jgi:hypothetical protein
VAAATRGRSGAFSARIITKLATNGAQCWKGSRIVLPRFFAQCDHRDFKAENADEPGGGRHDFPTPFNIARMSRAIVPFLIPLRVVLTCVTVWQPLTTWLPQLLIGR